MWVIGIEIMLALVLVLPVLWAMRKADKKDDDA